MTGPQIHTGHGHAGQAGEGVRDTGCRWLHLARIPRDEPFPHQGLGQDAGLCVQARGPGEANVPVLGHPGPEGARGRVANRPPPPSLSLTQSFARGITKRFLFGHY